MQQYKDLVIRIIREGCEMPDRTGVGRRSVFNHNMEFDVSESFPLLTHKRMPLYAIFGELVWFLSGSIDNASLAKLSRVSPDKTIWASWVGKDGTVGPMYGGSWHGKHGHHVDQVGELIWNIYANPQSRRLIVDPYNPEFYPDEGRTPSENVDMGKAALYPCHGPFQFFLDSDEVLSLRVNQRSCDVILGLGFNIASYAMLLVLIASICDCKVGKLYFNIGDAHIYLNHLNEGAVDKVLRARTYELPWTTFREDFETFCCDDVNDALDKEDLIKWFDETFTTKGELITEMMVNSIKDYEHGPSIKAAVAV